MSNTNTIFDRISAEITDATVAEIVATYPYSGTDTDGDDQVLANMLHGMTSVEDDLKLCTPASIAHEWVDGDFEPESKRAELEAAADAAFDRIAERAIAEILANRADAE